MIRSGSMLVAEALQRHTFGPSFKHNPELSKRCPRQIWMASLFNEEMKPDTRHFHPFSVQHLMELGDTKFGKREGEWFAPGTISQVYHHIISNYCEEQLNMSIYLCKPGFNTLYEVFSQIHIFIPVLPFLFSCFFSARFICLIRCTSKATQRLRTRRSQSSVVSNLSHSKLSVPWRSTFSSDFCETGYNGSPHRRDSTTFID